MDAQIIIARQPAIASVLLVQDGTVKRLAQHTVGYCDAYAHGYADATGATLGGTISLDQRGDCIEILRSARPDWFVA